MENFNSILPKKLNKNQLKFQLKFLESFSISSDLINLKDFINLINQQQIQSNQSIIKNKFKTCNQLKKSCNLNDLINPLFSILKDSNLLSELRDLQHELATPYGSLHTLHSFDLTNSPPNHPSNQSQNHQSSNQNQNQNQNHNQNHNQNQNQNQNQSQNQNLASSIDIPVNPTKIKIDNSFLDPTLLLDHQKPKRIRKKAARPRQSISLKPKPIQDLINRLSLTGLKTLQPTFDGMYYVRSVGKSDWNTSTQPIFSNLSNPLNPSTSKNQIHLIPPPVILTITFHPCSKSQENETKAIAPRKQTIHILSSQKLSDLKDVMICTADRIPFTHSDGSWSEIKWSAGSVISIENVLFSDKRNLEQNSGKSDYGLLIHTLAPSLVERVINPITIKDSSLSNSKLHLSSLGMESVTFDQLNIRVAEPYWLLHQGNCEHLFTIDEIRAIHPNDPIPTNSSNPYPITTFLSRLTSPKCRVCDRDPARLVTINDELTSESPCFICWNCFKLLHGHEIKIDSNQPNSIKWGKVIDRDWWVVPLLSSA